MKTDPKYMLDPYLKTLEGAKVLEVESEGLDKFRVILDKTIFYPMGGGQATDQGTITKGEDIFHVYQVQIKEGEIWHYLKSDKLLNVGDTVDGELDWERRYHNMKLHSAGHIIDFAIYLLGYSPDKLKPLKADHNKDLFILYGGTLDKDISAELQAKVNELIAKNLKFEWEFEDFDKLKSEAIYLQPNLPTNKPLRALRLEGVGAVADGGTIVKNTGEVESIEIVSVTKKGEETEVKYRIQSSAGSQKSATQNAERKTQNVNPKFDHSAILNEVTAKVQKAESADELTNLYREYLGKDGKVTAMLKDITKVAPEDRKSYGQSVNELKNQVDEIINSTKSKANSQKLKAYLDTPQAELNYDKAKVGHIHPLTQTINDLNKIFISLGYSIMDGPEIETDEYNFVRTNLPADHPARDLQDSIYVEEPNILLRTQTSAIEAHVLEKYEPPFKVVMPGRVYRNEKVNKSNHFTFHQYQLVCIQEKVSLADLIATIDYLAKSFIGPDVVMRYRNKYYPEVEPGLGPDMRCFNCKGKGCPICKGRGWIEMGGAGIRHPNMLKMAGIDPNKWQGYAFGLGLDRWAMAKHKITDIRTLLGGNLAYKPDINN